MLNILVGIDIIFIRSKQNYGIPFAADLTRY
jgi:hypothetical protein